MSIQEFGLNNYEVIICLVGGVVLGLFNVIWSKNEGGDVWELVCEYDVFLQGEKQYWFKFYFYDIYINIVYMLILNFEQVIGICDYVRFWLNVY